MDEVATKIIDILKNAGLEMTDYEIGQEEEDSERAT